MRSIAAYSIFCLATILNLAVAEKEVRQLGFNEAIAIAIKNDSGLIKNELTRKSYILNSEAALALPDPKLAITVANLPTDSFDFNQESMTQFKIGYSQMFPRGDTLKLTSHQMQVKGEQQTFELENRIGVLSLNVAKLWLDGYQIQESILLIKNNRALFEQIADVAQASYSSTVGKIRQHDIIRAQLELTRLDDKLIVLQQQFDMVREKLIERLGTQYSEQYLNSKALVGVEEGSFIFEEKLPTIKPYFTKEIFEKKLGNKKGLVRQIEQHPMIKSIKANIESSKVAVEIAKQKSKPAWGVNASYGYRDDFSNGLQRADLFSIGINFELPIFTENKQDKEISAAIYGAEATKTEKWLLLRKMLANINALWKQLAQIEKREHLYQTILIPQMAEQADASLTAYTNDDGDFSEVVRSRIAQLNTKIDSLAIRIEKAKITSELNYYFVQPFSLKEIVKMENYYDK